MKRIQIERRSIQPGGEITADFEAGPARPCILTDAARDWAAMGKWSLDYFAKAHGNAFGRVPVSFRDSKRPSKLTKLGNFIETMNEPFSQLSGFWLEPDGSPAREEPEFNESEVWSFGWDPIRSNPALLADISPFPACIPNLVASMPDGLYRAFQSVTGFQFHSIYISRPQTVTPLHSDHNHTIGCLVQFDGEKRVALFAAGENPQSGENLFDPDEPDYEQFPAMREAQCFDGHLQPGEMLIIPPDWWHHTRSLGPSITLSHNFFNHVNFSAFAHSVLEHLANKPGATERLAGAIELLRKIEPGFQSIHENAGGK